MGEYSNSYTFVEFMRQITLDVKVGYPEGSMGLSFVTVTDIGAWSRMDKH
jgi:hypothetical protein